MAFSDFKTLEQVATKYNINLETGRFFPQNLEIDLPQEFIDDLDFTLDRLRSDADEVVYCEALIYPYLKTIWKRHPMLNLWSHHPLNYDEVLNGKPDYLLSYLRRKTAYEMMTPPLVAVAEAKRDNFTEGWGQCFAEMVACQKLNENAREENNSMVIYGIVTTGRFWEFGKLHKDIFIKHSIPYSIKQPEVGGILDYIFTECEKQGESKIVQKSF